MSLGGVLGLCPAFQVRLSEGPSIYMPSGNPSGPWPGFNTHGKPSFTGWLLGYRDYLSSRISVAVAAHFLFWPNLCSTNCRS
jgi:hypothetical protein